MLNKSLSDILFISETKLDGTTSDSFLQQPGYCTIQCDHKKGAGGLIAFELEDLPVCRRHNLEPESIESLCLDLMDSRKARIIVCACYRSPKFCQITDFLSSLTSATELMYKSSQEILLIGDFNIDMLVREHGHDHDNTYLPKVLNSVFTIQRSIRHLLSLPGYSNLIKCDSYLRRFNQYSTGLTSTLTCPRIHKSSLSECKQWALQTSSPPLELVLPCRFLFDFSQIYTATGRSCDSNTVTNLHSTLRALTNSMSMNQSLVHTVNGKIVYLIKTTDNLNTKLTSIIGTLHNIDATFNEWAQ